MSDRLIRVTAPHFVAGAVWSRREYSRGWTCVKAAPILRWMRGLSEADASTYLLRNGWRWEWVK